MDSPDGLIWMSQQEYGWYIAAYLFFSGLAGGAYLTGFFADLFGWRSDDASTERSMREITQWGVVLSLSAIAGGWSSFWSFISAHRCGPCSSRSSSSTSARGS